MSWFTDLAGRAEALLDKMDQAAATSLQDVGIANTSLREQEAPGNSSHSSGEMPSRSSLAYEPTAQTPSPLPQKEMSGGVAQLLVGSASKSTMLMKPKEDINTTVTRSPHLKSYKTNTAPTDDSLFEFLNSPSKAKETSQSNRSAKPKKVATKVARTTHLPRPHSTPVMAQPRSGEEGEDGDTTAPSQWHIGEVKSETLIEEVDSKLEPPNLTSGNDEDEIEKEAESSAAEPSDRLENINENEHTQSTTDDSQLHAKFDSLQQKLSNLELENKLLKREVSSLNVELSLVTSRIKDMGDSTAHYESEIDALREQASRSDHMIRQQRSHEEDLQAALEARDSQIQVLRMRLAEADSDIGDFRQQSVNYQKEKERLLQDSNLSSDANSQALDSLKSLLQQTNTQLQLEREACERTKMECAERDSLLQSQVLQLTEALSAHQRQLSLQQAKTAETQAALQSTHNELKLVRKDHKDYKHRAAGILQAKEKLIASLQSEGGGVAMGGAQEAKLEELRLEKEHVQAQLTTAQQQIENLKSDIQEMEERHSSDAEGLLEQVRVCEGALEEERRMHTSTREELGRSSQEVDQYRGELLRERATFTSQLQEKEVELSSLQAKVTSVTPGRVELESRLHELTESLIQKQTTLEALNSEKHSLNLQLDRMKSQLAEAQRLQPNRVQTIVNGLDNADQESSRVRSVDSILPSVGSSPAGSHLHKVRRAVNTVDRFSIRLGVFLRRYPQARLFTLLYMVLLHIWVMVVLLTYTPESHDINDPMFGGPVPL